MFQRGSGKLRELITTVVPQGAAEMPRLFITRVNKSKGKFASLLPAVVFHRGQALYSGAGIHPGGIVT
jgi:hypothetical protein